MKYCRPLVCYGVLFLCAYRLYAQQVSFDPHSRSSCSQETNVPIPAECVSDKTMPCTDKSFFFECALRDQKLEKMGFTALKKSMEQRSPEEQTSYDRLVVSFHVFYKLHEESEEGHSCTYCGALEEFDHVAMNYQFLAMAGGLGASGFPTLTASDLSHAEASLNRAYRARLAEIPPEKCPAIPYSISQCVSGADARETERAWMRYRDAWIAFAGLRWPDVPAEVWSTQLSRLRTKQLEPLE